jgi:hypothetical protein
MGYFNFKRPALGSYLDRRNPPYLNRNRAIGSWKGHRESVTASGFNHERFNSQKARIEEGSIIEDWIPRQPTMLHLLLRRIYLRDSIAGSVIDIYSTLPWGKIYELIGVDDPKISQMYQDMIENLGIWGDLAVISREFLIIGRMIASLPFNETTGIWDSMIPIDPDQAKIQPVPFAGVKPLIDVLSSPAWREFARSVDPRIVEMKEKMNKDTLAIFQNTSGYFPLDPMNTLFLARRVNQYDHIGTSFFTRILPAWAYETALWDASLTGVRRCNRSILLVTAGIEETWEPNDSELSSLTQIFMQADEDPTGAVISVRNGVEISEVRDPTAIWGISQEFEFLSTLKMRALGVSEAYLSGDANVSNMETARTSLGKAVASFRDNMLREIFTKQLFPSFARIHNFQKRTQAQLDNRIRIETNRVARMAEYDRRMYEGEHLTKWGYPMITAKQALDIPLDSLIMPRLITEDTLRPEQDTAYMEMLDKLKENGVPIPLRIWASAAGYDLDKAMAMMEEDIILKKRLNQLSAGDMADSADLGGGGGSDDLFGGGGGGNTAPSGGGGQTAKGMFKGDEEGASSGRGGSATLPPKWGFTASQAKVGASTKLPYQRRSTSKEVGKANDTLKVFRDGHDPYVKMLSSIAPNLLADLRVPHGKELMPYTD